MAKTYKIQLGPSAERTYRSLPRDAKTALDAKLKGISRDPYQNKPRRGGPEITHQATFGDFGFLEYCIHESYVAVSVITITWAG